MNKFKDQGYPFSKEFYLNRNSNTNATTSTVKSTNANKKMESPKSKIQNMVKNRMTASPNSKQIKSNAPSYMNASKDISNKKSITTKEGFMSLKNKIKGNNNETQKKQTRIFGDESTVAFQGNLELFDEGNSVDISQFRKIYVDKVKMSRLENEPSTLKEESSMVAPIAVGEMSAMDTIALQRIMKEKPDMFKKKKIPRKSVSLKKGRKKSLKGSKEEMTSPKQQGSNQSSINELNEPSEKGQTQGQEHGRRLRRQSLNFVAAIRIVNDFSGLGEGAESIIMEEKPAAKESKDTSFSSSSNTTTTINSDTLAPNTKLAIVKEELSVHKGPEVLNEMISTLASSFIPGQAANISSTGVKLPVASTSTGEDHPKYSRNQPLQRYGKMKGYYIPPPLGTYMGHSVHKAIYGPPFPIPVRSHLLYGPFEEKLNSIHDLYIPHPYHHLDYYYMPIDKSKKSILVFPERKLPIAESVQSLHETVSNRESVAKIIKQSMGSRPQSAESSNPTLSHTSHTSHAAKERISSAKIKRPNSRGEPTSDIPSRLNERASTPTKDFPDMERRPSRIRETERRASKTLPFQRKPK